MGTKIIIKTTKGAQALAEKSSKLDELHKRILSLLDGSRGIPELAAEAGCSEPEAAERVNKLLLIGYARSTGIQHNEGPQTSGATFGPEPAGDEQIQLDIGSLQAQAKTRSESAAARFDMGSAADSWQQTQEAAETALRQRLEEERRQREAAEEALRLAKERELAEAAARKAAEIELAKQAAAKAERDRLRREQEELRQREIEIEEARARRLGIRRKRLRLAAAASLALCFLAWGARLQSTLGLDAKTCESIASSFSGSPVSIKSCQTQVFPLPKIEALGIEAKGFSADAFEAHMSIPSAMLGRISLTGATLKNTTVDLLAVSKFMASPSKGVSGLREIAIDNAAISLGGQTFQGFNGTLQFDSMGRASTAAFSDEERLVSVSLTPEKGSVKFAGQARFPEDSQAPLPMLRDASAYGTVKDGVVSIEEGTLSFANGSAKFTAECFWDGTLWVGKGGLESRLMPLPSVYPWLFSSGSFEAKASFKFKSPSLPGAPAAASIEADGEFKDAVMRLDLPSLIGATQSNGSASFASGRFSIARSEGATSFKATGLSSGPYKLDLNAGRRPDATVFGTGTLSMTSRSLILEFGLGGTASNIQLTAKGQGR